MNVEEARRLYLEGKREQEALDEATYQDSIKGTDKLIKKNASEGNPRCGVACIPRFRDRFISHYKKKGFKVSNISNSVTISWELEEPNEEWFRFTHYSSQSVSYDVYSKKPFDEIAPLYRAFHSVLITEEEKMIDILILLKEIHNGLNNSFHFKIFGEDNALKVMNFIEAMGYEVSHIDGYGLEDEDLHRWGKGFLITVSKGWLN